MIVFSRVPEPSFLLLTGDLNRQARTLLRQCDEDTFLQRPGAVDLVWQQAQSLDGRRNTEGFAIVAIRLAECFRACHRLGPALRCAEGARDILSRWPHKRQKQNLAVALYACGIVHQCLGSYEEACTSYEEALAVFEEAREQRQALGLPAEFEEQCSTAERAIEGLSAYVARAATCGDWGANQFCCLMGYWLAERGPLDTAQPAVSASLREAVIGMDLRLGSQIYRLEGLADGPDLRLVPPPDKDYLLLEVPEDMAQTLGEAVARTELQGAKYALVESGIPSACPGLGIRWAEDEGLLWGEFVRDPDTEVITFVARYQDQPLRAPKFIGEVNLAPDRSGLVVGVFK